MTILSEVQAGIKSAIEGKSKQADKTAVINNLVKFASRKGGVTLPNGVIIKKVAGEYSAGRMITKRDSDGNLVSRDFEGTVLGSVELNNIVDSI